MNKLSAILERCKFLFELILMGLMAYVFTFYLDGDIGVVVWSFFILAPLLSVLLSYHASRKLKISLDAPDYLAKGREFSVNLVAETTSELPVPFLKCVLQSSANVIQQDARAIQSTMMPKGTLEIPDRMTAKYAGAAEISIKETGISDYLGLFHFRIPGLPDAVRIGVIPDIPEITSAGMMLHAVSDVILTQDDEEEESSASFSAKSMPGYVHREYVAGDNLRRINWKMSAKRQKLMVRMDEAASTTQPSLILDLHPENQEEDLKRREIMMEGALGFLILLVRQGIPCTIRFASSGNWKCLTLEQEDDVRNAAVELAVADFVNDSHRIDLTAMQEKSGAYLIYTTRPDVELAMELTDLKNKGYVCAVCPAETQSAVLSEMDALWELGEDFAMQNLKK